MARLSDSQVLNLWTKSYSGTMQVKRLWQYIILCDTINNNNIIKIHREAFFVQ